MDDISSFLNAFYFLDSDCIPTLFNLVALVDPLSGYDQATHADGLVSIDASTNSLVTSYDPTRTFKSKYAIQAKKTGSWYDIASTVDLIEIRF
jgi:hypothetical protein